MSPWSAAPLFAALASSSLVEVARGQLASAAAPAPATARSVELSLSASPARLILKAGVPTPVFSYNGTVPGPTLDLREGDNVTIRFRNELPVATTVHWHGFHLPFESDGSPFHPVAPGETYEYRFTVPPGTAGTYWYHPHPDHSTGAQVARGLYGAIIVRAADDPLAALPEQVLILSDNRLTPEGEIDFPDPHSMHGRRDRENGREGELLLVNGKVLPTLTIRSGEVQRWRVINASAGRSYRLALAGQTLLHVGSDGGLFERPVEVSELLVSPSERVEFLVRGSGAPGSSTALQALPYDRYVPQTRPENWNEVRNLATLEYTSEPPMTPPPLPATLRKVEPIDTTLATATRVIVLGQGLINGKVMDMSRVDVSTTVGATEIWQVENVVGMDHPFHLHGFRFQVLDRNGVPEPFLSWKDMVNVPKHETVRFIVTYDDFPGKWMFHCHILDHEDHGMMGVLEIRGDPQVAR
ncbi:MAG TPA: multicopper oxidase family protein [Gemmatimonadales bacterium]|nr:multicopper oxidase family protein [Gemmatimonadales bacterium]